MKDIGFTPERLPIVTRELIRVLNRDYKRDFRIFGEGDENDESIFSREIKQLIRHNNGLYNYLENTARGVYKENKDMMTGRDIRDVTAISFLTGAIMCYTALRKQAEANKLEKELKGERR